VAVVRGCRTPVLLAHVRRSLSQTVLLADIRGRTSVLLAHVRRSLSQAVLLADIRGRTSVLLAHVRRSLDRAVLLADVRGRTSVLVAHVRRSLGQAVFLANVRRSLRQPVLLGYIEEEGRVSKGRIVEATGECFVVLVSIRDEQLVDVRRAAILQLGDGGGDGLRGSG
jgi:hypothetical protein